MTGVSGRAAADRGVFPLPERWDDGAEVVIVGGGGCGLVAAIAAARIGARVRVLEKLPRVRGNTGRSGGMIPAAGTRFQRAAGIEEEPEDFAADVWRKNGHRSERHTTLHLCRTSAELLEWLTDEIGIELVFIDDFTYPGHSTRRMHAPPSRTGEALIEGLRSAAEREANIALELGCPVLGPVAAEGVVRGVMIDRGGQRLSLRAERVILACNGFAGNREMVRRHLPDMAEALYFGGEGNTGEGILWGRALGAETAFMDAYQAHASVATPEHILITYSLIMEGGIQINSAGERFGDETSGYSEHALAVLRQPGGEVWNLYDERLHRLGLKFADYRHATECGAVQRYHDLGSLAAGTGVDPAALRRTVDRYHRAADGGADPYGRIRCARLAAPFYAVRVTGALFHTQGGLRVDDHARVLRPDRSPIGNLYAGGGVAAGISGHGPGGYLSGNGLLTALGYGMLAGRHAAASLRGEG